MARVDSFWSSQDYEVFLSTLEGIERLDIGEHLSVYRCDVRLETGPLHDYLDLLRSYGIPVGRGNEPFGFRMPQPELKSVGSRELQVFRRTM